LNLNYSNSFALLEHKTQTPWGKNIKFFSLYMHLRPYGLLSDDEKSNLFYFYRTVFARGTYACIGLALYSNKERTGHPTYLPSESYIEVTTDPLWNLPEAGTTLAKVRTRYQPHKNMEGYINLNLCTLVQDAVYQTVEKLEIYNRNSGDLIGTIPSRTVLVIPDQKAYIQDMDDRIRTRWNQLLRKKKPVYLRVDSANLVIAEEGYVSLDSGNPLFQFIETRVIMKRDAELYDKKFKRTGRFLHHGDQVEIVENSCINRKGEKYCTVRRKFEGLIDGLAYMAKDDVSITPALYHINSKLVEGSPEVGNGEKKGILVRNALTRYRNKEKTICNEVIDIIQEGDPVHFENIDEFLDLWLRAKGPIRNYLKLDSTHYNYQEDAFVYVCRGQGEKNEYSLSFSLDPPSEGGPWIADEVDPNGNVFSYPAQEKEKVPLSSKAILGYAGDMLQDKNIVHFEVFTDNTGFFTPIKQNGKDEEKLLYQVKPGLEGLKKCSVIAAKVALETSIPAFSCLKVITEAGEKLGESPFKTIRRVKRASGAPVEGWVLWTQDTWNHLKWDSKYYRGQDDSTLSVFTTCPTKNNQEPETVDVQIFQGEIFPLLQYSKQVVDALTGATTSEFGDYRKFKFYRTLEEGDASQTFFIDTSETGTKDVITNKILELQATLTNVYNANPEIFDFSQPDTQSVQQKHSFTEIKGSAVDANNKRYFKIEIGPGKESWISETDFNGKITKLNYFKWTDFFKELTDTDTDGVLELSDLLKSAEVSFSSSTLDEGAVQEALQNPDVYEAVSNLYVQHTTEWNTKNNAYYDVLKGAPYALEQDEIDDLKSYYETMDFWPDASKALPGSNRLTFFHPVKFLDHLQEVTAINWLEFVKGMQKRGSMYYGTVRSGKEIIFQDEDVYNSTLTALMSTAENQSRDGKTLSENTKATLDTCAKFLLHPEVGDMSSIQINCLYNARYLQNGVWIERSDDSSHRFGQGVDLGGQDFKFNDLALPYNKEKALSYAKLLMKLGATSILHNCQYVVDNAKSGVGGYDGHHHHFHVDFHWSLSDFGTDVTNDYNCYGTVYNCVNYSSESCKNCRRK